MASSNNRNVLKKKCFSNNKTSRQYQEMVLNQVNEMFDSIFEPDVILSVVQNCNWKLQPSVEALIGLSTSADLPIKEQNRMSFEFPSNTKLDVSNTPNDCALDEEIGFLNINDAELHQQREELKKFEHLKKKLTHFQSNTNQEESLPQLIKGAATTVNPNIRSSKEEYLSTPGATSSTCNEDDSRNAFRVIHNFNFPVKLQRNNELLYQKNDTKINKSSDLMDFSKCQEQFDLPMEEKNEIQSLNYTKNCEMEGMKPIDFIMKQCNQDMNSEEHTYNYKPGGPNMLKVNGSVPAIKSGSSYEGEMCGLKVEYRHYDLHNGSDDDADVGIENENADFNSELLSAAPIKACQFLCPNSPLRSKHLDTNTIQTSMSYASSNNGVISRLEESIHRGYKVLIILRGLPGSGKSTLARNIVFRTLGPCETSNFIFSSDDFFITNGKYQFTPAKLEEVHRLNQSKVLQAAQEGRSPIIIDNTNTQLSEMIPYVNCAVNHGYILEVLEANTPWAQKPSELARRNVHGVPKSKIEQMLKRYARNVTGDKLIQRFKFKYVAGNWPPQMRSYPPLKSKNDEEVEKPKPKRNRRGVRSFIQTSQFTDEITKEYNAINDTSNFDKEHSRPTKENLVVENYVEHDEAFDTWNVADSASNTSGKDDSVFHSSNRYSCVESYLQNSSQTLSLQSLGIIDSECKSDTRPLLADEKPIFTKDVLPQCWDFTLFLNGKQIHSIASLEPSTANVCKSMAVQLYTQKYEKEFVNKVFVNNGNVTYLVDSCIINNLLNDEAPKIIQEIHSKLKNKNENIDQNDVSNFNSMFQYFMKNKSINSRKNKAEEREEFSNSVIDTSSKSSSYISPSKELIASVTDTLTKRFPNSAHCKKKETFYTQETTVSFYINDIEEVTPTDSLSYKLSRSATIPEILRGLKFCTETQSAVNVESITESNRTRYSEQNDNLKEVTFLENTNMDLNSHFYQENNIIDEKSMPKVLKAINQKKKKSLISSMEKITTSINALSKEFRVINDQENRINVSSGKNDIKDESHLNYIWNQLLNSSPQKEQCDSKVIGTIDNINQITWKESPFPISDIPLSKNVEIKRIDTVDVSTNTCAYDFNIAYVGGTSELQYKVIRAFNRSINDGFVSSNLDMLTQPKLMLHKSSMTDDLNIYYDETNSNDEDKNKRKDRTDELAEMFPHIPRDYISEIYKNVYNQDFNWAVEFFLEGVPEDIIKYQNMHSTKFDFVNTVSTGTKKNIQSQISGSSRKKEKNQLSEKTLALQRHLEEKIKLKETSYHPHILRVKRWKNKEPDMPLEEIEAQIIDNEALEFATLTSNNEIESPNSKSNDMIGDTVTAEDDNISKDVDTNMDNEDMLELNLGKELIEVLEKEFGNLQFEFPEGLLPIVQIRKSMARELYALWIESMQQQLNVQQQQLDAMILKDAEYAKILEEEEARAVIESREPNLTEIMDMELALATYSNELKEKLKRETPNDMASRLTRNLLHEMFPHSEPAMLNQVLSAHNGNFKETVEVLETNIGKITAKKNVLEKQKNLMKQVRENSDFQVRMCSTPSPMVVVNSDLKILEQKNRMAYDHVVKVAEESRQEALRQFSLRTQNYNKAVEATKKRIPEVAEYYSQMAQLHDKNMKCAHTAAANAYLALQTYTFDDGITLDLHYLYVQEALQALDVFLEHQMEILRTGTKPFVDLYIITGRGARSYNGKSKIKPAITKRLANKNIRFSEANPGCLKVTLRRKDCMISQS